MKKLLIIGLWILGFTNVKAQQDETYFVAAPSGLKIREAPNLQSKTIGKLRYGVVLEIIEETDHELQIQDQNIIVKGKWVKINLDYTPYIPEKSSPKNIVNGYVFNGYLEKLNKAHLETTALDSISFYTLYKKNKQLPLPRITSILETQKLLKDNVSWVEISDGEFTINQVKLDNGLIVYSNQDVLDNSFVAYFPTEKVILLKGGHASDNSVSLKTGETLETVGNPDYILSSPNGTLRLNGWHSGQECSHYFIQQKVNGNYKYVVALEPEHGLEEFVCYFKTFSWINDSEFVYSYKSAENNKAIVKYFKAKVVFE